MLTELGHGLDARNLQTTATMLPDGGFDLHTPTPDAAKCMPVSTPIGGLEKIAIVFARLHISGQDHGVRGFIVRLNDGERMMHGITAKLLPYRAGSNYLDHAITTFDHVRLASTALLGKVPSGPPSNHRDDFANLIWRVPIGTLSLSLSSLPSLKASAWIAGQYAMKRRVGTQSAPIIHFRTQQIPIFHTIAQAYVMEGYARWSIARFMDPAVDNRLRHAYAMLFKTVAMEHSLTSARILSQEIGWRGLFEDNQLIRFELECRGNKIAEGDITVLCIRLTSDILHGKVTIPPPRNPATLLAKHEAALLSEI
ncbi:acyl-CoA dehydrogenase/oxidase C-terminal [Aspergillus keveii]|uniref:Acyl-CoA dehydrogenase/oxidase C-terminal n=1 Tax=Aspergillus keveii TaxID=714993 RepID=A0ABR4FLY1_9EURO